MFATMKGYVTLVMVISSACCIWNLVEAAENAAHPETDHPKLSAFYRTYDDVVNNSNVTATLSPACEGNVSLVLESLTNGSTWALAVVNSWGKEESNFLDGDNFWEGSYDTCVSYKRFWEEEWAAGDVGPPVKYCTVEWDSDMYGAAVGASRDGVGLCLPTSCTVDDYKLFLRSGIETGLLSAPPGYPVDDSAMEVECPKTGAEKAEELGKDASAIAALSVMGFFVLLAVIGTIYDVVMMYRGEGEERKEKELRDSGISNGSTKKLLRHPIKRRNKAAEKFGEVLAAFSVRRNMPRIVNYEEGEDSIGCLHGIRFLTFAWIVLGHVWTLGLIEKPQGPVLGAKFRWLRMMNSVEAQVLGQMNIAVETFFVLSAMLTAVSLFNKLGSKKPDCQMMGLYYFHRFWRLTPVYMLVLMFYACLYPYLGSGPWYREHADSQNCKQNWWAHLIYINNFHWPSGECMGWTWYLANDFQFYVFAPALLFPLYLVPPLGITLAIVCAAGGMIARGVLYNQALIEGKQLNDFFDIYIKPWARCTTYFMGMLLGYLLFRLKFKARMNPGFAVLGWLLGLAAVAGSIFPAFDRLSWTQEGVVAWETMQRPMFAAGVGWIIFACCTENGGFINDILSWRGWLPWSRISYVGYLIHPIVIYWYIATRPQQVYPDTLEMIYWFMGHMLLTLGISLVVSLLYEVPFACLEKLMFADLDKNKQKRRSRRSHPVETLEIRSSYLSTKDESFRVQPSIIVTDASRESVHL